MNKSIGQPVFESVEAGLLSRTLCNELLESYDLVVLATNGVTDDRRDSGPSNSILLHRASQLLMTSVNLPLSSPSSTCNA